MRILTVAMKRLPTPRFVYSWAYFYGIETRLSAVLIEMKIGTNKAGEQVWRQTDNQYMRFPYSFIRGSMSYDFKNDRWWTKKVYKVRLNDVEKDLCLSCAQMNDMLFIPDIRDGEPVGNTLLEFLGVA